MTKRARRRRAAALLSLALACGALAASEVGDRARDVESRIGKPVPVVVAGHDLDAGLKLRRSDLAIRQIPHRYAPRDAPAVLDQAIGLQIAGPVAVGSPITAGVIVGAADRAGPNALRRGERAVEIAVTGGALLEAASPGTRVDVLVSTESSDRGGRTFIALEDVELLGLQPGSGGEGIGPSRDAGLEDGSSTTATLRVRLRQAVYLIAAQNFARELRLLPRPPGDGRHVGRAGVDASSL